MYLDESSTDIQSFEEDVISALGPVTKGKTSQHFEISHQCFEKDSIILLLKLHEKGFFSKDSSMLLVQLRC